MPAPPNPIDIATPKRFSSTSPPQNQASNLTSALQRASENNTKPTEVPSKNPAQDPRPVTGRQDSMNMSLGSSHSGARPIGIAGSNHRKELASGSYMGGMSWGGMSVGSWLQDDIMMSGTSPYNTQSPSLHSSSYLPKMEANFWTNLKCCDITFSDLHELLAHFEDVHSQAPSTFPYRMSSGSTGFQRRKSSSRAPFSGLPAVSTPGNQVRGFNPPTSSGLKDNEMSALEAEQTNQNGQQKQALSGMQDMDTIGQMDMDDDINQTLDPGNAGFDMSQNGPFSQDTTPRLGQAVPAYNGNRPEDYQMPHADTTLSNVKFLINNNPMVSSVNTPAINAQRNASSQDHANQNQNVTANQNFGQGFQSPSVQFDPQMLENLNAGFGNLDFSNNSMADYCIDEPAKALYSENGTINATRFPQFSFANGKAGDDATQNLQARRLAAGFAANGAPLPNEEDRPFKCPVIGCEKAYKNANGLRYHEKHGHSTQQLKENPDGTMSIVDPVTSMPYPGTVGMEKEKPYRCEVCGKRYKNLNGLKYHRNHSPPCNPDFDVNNFTANALHDGAVIAGEPVF